MQHEIQEALVILLAYWTMKMKMFNLGQDWIAGFTFFLAKKQVEKEA